MSKVKPSCIGGVGCWPKMNVSEKRMRMFLISLSSALLSLTRVNMVNRYYSHRGLLNQGVDITFPVAAAQALMLLIVCRLKVIMLL